MDKAKREPRHPNPPPLIDPRRVALTTTPTIQPCGRTGQWPTKLTRNDFAPIASIVSSSWAASYSSINLPPIPLHPTTPPPLRLLRQHPASSLWNRKRRREQGGRNLRTHWIAAVSSAPNGRPTHNQAAALRGGAKGVPGMQQRTAHGEKPNYPGLRRTACSDTRHRQTRDSSTKSGSTHHTRPRSPTPLSFDNPAKACRYRLWGGRGMRSQKKRGKTDKIRARSSQRTPFLDSHNDMLLRLRPRRS